MTFQKNIADEITARIKKDIDYFQGSMPERYAIAWHAYLAGLLEWGVIEVSTHKQLIGLLPTVDDDPSVAILLGRD